MNSPTLSNTDIKLTKAITERAVQDNSVWSLPKNNRRENGHALFQYPAMMVPEVQEILINIITSQSNNIETMCDPFVGAGTAIAASMTAGLNCYGQDLNPLGVLLTKVKSGPFYPDALSDHVECTIRYAREDISNKIEISFPNMNKWFKLDVAVELSKLRRSIQRDSQIWARRFMWIVLAETIRLASNDRTSTYKLHARPLSEIHARKISPIELFSQIAQRSIDDVTRFSGKLNRLGRLNKGHFKNEVAIKIGNTVESINIKKRTYYDLIVTSPPYGDNLSTITYGQHSYLPLQWIDMEDIEKPLDKSVLQTTLELDRRSIGGRLSLSLNEAQDRLRLVSPTLNNVFEQLESDPRDRKVRVAAFYTDFDRAIKNVADHIRLDGYAIVTIGNRHVGGKEIANDSILVEMLRHYGLIHVCSIERVIHAKRMPHRNTISNLMSREKIGIFRKYV